MDQVVDCVPKPVAEFGVPLPNVQVPVPAEPPEYVKLAGCPAQTIGGIENAALAVPPHVTSSVSYKIRLEH